MILECKLFSTSEIGSHTHFIGEILDVKVEESLLREDGLPDIIKNKAGTFMDPKYNPITLLESFWEKLSLLERKSKMNEGRALLWEGLR